MRERITLRYARTEQSAELAAARIVHLAPDDPEPVDDPAEMLIKKLASPDFGPALNQVARSARKPVIVVSDITRKTGIQYILHALIGKVRECVDPSAVIRVLVAYGNHRRHTAEEDNLLYGSLPAGAELLHHDSSDASSLTDFGALPSGQTLRIHSAAAESDCLILTGAVGFHYTAGFSGGRKAVLPGIASYDNVVANHAMTLIERQRTGPRFWEPGQLDGNRISEDMEAARELVKPAFLINTVLAGDQIGRIFTGDPYEAHRAACAFVAERYTRDIGAPADLVVASCGGYPKDLNFYQAHKPLDMAARACRDGGVVVLVADCPDGWGAESFIRHARLPDWKVHLTALQKTFEVPGQTALAYREKIERVRVILVSAIPDDEVIELGMTPAPDLASGLKAAADLLGADPACAVIMPRAGETLPRVSAVSI